MPCNGNHFSSLELKHLLKNEKRCRVAYGIKNKEDVELTLSQKLKKQSETHKYLTGNPTYCAVNQTNE